MRKVNLHKNFHLFLSMRGLMKNLSSTFGRLDFDVFFSLFYSEDVSCCFFPLLFCVSLFCFFTLPFSGALFFVSVLFYFSLLFVSFSWVFFLVSFFLLRSIFLYLCPHQKIPFFFVCCLLFVVRFGLTAKERWK